ncbi:MAG: hypothetical protein H7Y07_16010 [Pyrinomonadaceae bacterium]|nr:hypothetical protein [Sphingobacteriaceae bacterium]
MIEMKPQYIIDDSGKKISVVISIAEYEKMLEDLDDAYCSKLYTKALELNEPSIPLEEYIRSRKNPDA